MRELSQLKTCFVSKDKGTLTQVPIAALKEAVMEVFNHFRQVDDISAKICESVQVEVEIDGVKKKMADSGRLNTMKEFLKCVPMKVSRDKNNSTSMN